MRLQVSGTVTVDTGNVQIEIDGSEFDFELEESYDEPSGTENVSRATYDGEGFTVVATMHEYPPLVVSQSYVEVASATLVSNDLSFEFTESEDDE